MIINSATRDELQAALELASSLYDNNIIWNHAPEPLNEAETRWRCTLRCISSRGVGHGVTRLRRGGKTYRRRSVSACWHVRGAFLEALPASVSVYDAYIMWWPGDAWPDFDIGTRACPVLTSESCDCEGFYEPNNRKEARK